MRSGIVVALDLHSDIYSYRNCRAFAFETEPRVGISLSSSREGSTKWELV